MKKCDLLLKLTKDYREALIKLTTEMEFEEKKEVPKLSDTERVILENLPNVYVNISKALSGILYIGGGKNCNLSLSIYNHLFEFIKRGEKYLIEDLLNNN
jgi:hypothetical protein